VRNPRSVQSTEAESEGLQSQALLTYAAQNVGKEKHCMQSQELALTSDGFFRLFEGTSGVSGYAASSDGMKTL
jgi:hypothetical protein